MARGKVGGDLILGVFVAGVAAYLWLQYRNVTHKLDTSAPDPASLGSGGGSQCMSYSTPDLTLGSTVIPGEQRTVCLG